MNTAVSYDILRIDCLVYVQLRRMPTVASGRTLRNELMAALGRARRLYATFLEKSDGREAFHDARERALARIVEIDEMGRFLAPSAP